MSDQRCKTCGETVHIYVTADNFRVPVNLGGIVTVIDDHGKVYQGFVPHWSTCKDPGDKRKG